MGKRLNALRHDLRMYRLSLRLQLKAATRLRGAFVLQVVGMIFNNIGLTIAWWFLFVSFGTINGWNGADFIGMQGVNMFIFGMVVLVSTGVFELARYVDRGIFDTFLTRPSSLLGQVCSSAVEIAALGDILLGVVFMGWYMIYIQVSLLAILAWLAAMLIGIVLMWCFVLLPFILAFYIFDSEKIGRSAWGLFLDMGIYPSGVISGGLRTFLLTVFPGLFVGAVPLNVLRGIGWEYLLLGLVVAAFWLTVTLFLFRRAVRHYESANLVGAR